MVLIKKRRDTGWTIKSIEDQKSEDKKVNKLWQKLFNMAIITGLDLKTRFSWEKKKRLILSTLSSILVQMFLCVFFWKC